MPVNDKPITIVELTGLPTEIINVVVSVLARMTFDFAHWSEGKVPLTLVCEEAHRYVPAMPRLGFEPCKRAIAKIAKEGRKYGVALCIVSQRPAEIDPTILSQCNTVFALRMSNDRDQEIVTSAITDTGSGLLEFLPALGQREALAFGDGVALPVRINFDELPADALPRSTTAHFTEHWQRSVGDEGFLEQVVEKWRSSDIGAGGDAIQQAAMLAEGMAIEPSALIPEPPRMPEPRRATSRSWPRACASRRRRAASAAALRPHSRAAPRPRIRSGPARRAGASQRRAKRPPAAMRNVPGRRAQIPARPPHPAPPALTPDRALARRIAGADRDDAAAPRAAHSPAGGACACVCAPSVWP